MEKLCKIRDIQRSIADFEQHFESKYGIGLNEGMALCSLYQNAPLSASQIAQHLGLKSSHVSKIIASVEKKELLERTMGKEDKRQMYFNLTIKGKELISSVKSDEMILPDLLNDII